ncbi:M15 family metallopeptidase [Candidatus Uabimicrobium amorphum]|uniref:Peptidase M15 n=1 Tax=Uabimicrobium amorphum TaxID=2596890 RepID=A0A5S9IS90_UABAM|nr:M15 family metallopeptidase [Candidatus Uabimicrobium amorphum]BBM86482.1 peptidase M15 [Candidatus Uabimicrobium amorphum]
MNDVRELQLTGQVRTHITQIDEPRFAAHPKTVEAFLAMRDAAQKEGIILQPFSSFRNLKTQIRIWNKKFRGEKPLYNIHGQERDYHSLDKNEIIDAILGWSALPGASRHHWGSEIDVVDAAVMPQNYRVQLLPNEVQSDGIFARLHVWLDENMHKFDFFRPYRLHQGGMFPEPWHLSHAPISIPAQQELSIAMIENVIRNNHLEGKELLLRRLPQIFRDHINNVCLP